nr:helix-turn-helix domain-containing protein [Nocardia bovistercoris]
MEVQLSRPGPARDRLAAILDPLDDRPELLDLLRVHLSNNLNRQLTAEVFAIHPNTVDHRLERISRLTGRNPSSADDAFALRSALIARTATTPDRGPESPEPPTESARLTGNRQAGPPEDTGTHAR